MQDVFISAAFVDAVLRHAPAHGVDVDRALRRAGIPPAVRAEPGARVSARQYADLQAMVMREMGDELLGYAPEPLPLGTGAALAHWMLHARSLGRALKRCVHFYGMLGRGIQPVLRLEDSSVRLLFEPWRGAPRPEPYAYELAMFGLHRFCCWLTRRNLRIEAVALAFSAPSHLREYRAVFYGAPVRFNAPNSEFVFPRTLLHLPIRQDQAALEAFLQHPQHHLLRGDHGRESWTRRTRDALRDQLESGPTLAAVADRLGLSPKQLRRHLGNEDITWGELKEQLRRDVAIEHLGTGDRPVEEIASVCGFAEASTFIRAFRKWTGHTPYAYRKRFYAPESMPPRRSNQKNSGTGPPF